jgi:hypothetical protein
MELIKKIKIGNLNKMLVLLKHLLREDLLLFYIQIVLLRKEKVYCIIMGLEMLLLSMILRTMCENDIWKSKFMLLLYILNFLQFN